jgi:hypothetical protein
VAAFATRVRRNIPQIAQYIYFVAPSMSALLGAARHFQKVSVYRPMLAHGATHNKPLKMHASLTLLKYKITLI